MKEITLIAVITAVCAGALYATPRIGVACIEAGLIEAPSNYAIYKDELSVTK